MEMIRNNDYLLGNQHNKKFNKTKIIDSNYLWVYLTQGQKTKVNRRSWSKIKHLKFYAHWMAGTQSFYAGTPIRENNKRITYRMHQLIKPAIKPMVTDHINGDTLDNRDKNLEVVSQSKNIRKGKKFKTRNGIACTSKYKGVSWNKNEQKWTSCFWVNGKRYFLGYFTTEKEAHDAREERYIK